MLAIERFRSRLYSLRSNLSDGARAYTVVALSPTSPQATNPAWNTGLQYIYNCHPPHTITTGLPRNPSTTAISIEWCHPQLHHLRTPNEMYGSHVLWPCQPQHSAFTKKYGWDCTSIANEIVQKGVAIIGELVWGVHSCCYWLQ